MDPIMTFKQDVTTDSTSVELPAAPAKTVPRIYPGAPHRDASIELQRVERPPASCKSNADNEEQDVEMSRPTTPVLHSDGVEVLPSIWDPYMNRFRFLSSCLMGFQSGLNDSAPGALIPYIEKDYNIGYAVVSLIFVGNALGAIVAAGCVDVLRARLGRAKSLALSQFLLTLAYIPLVVAAPFPVIVVCFFMVGFASSVIVAITNIFCGGMRNDTTALGGMHGSYGIGGTVGPLVATSIVAVGGAVWSRFYFLTLGMSVFNACFGFWSFRGYEKEIGSGPSAQPQRIHSVKEHVRGMANALSTRAVLMGALFIFAYQGAEVSISGWVISFLITARQGDPSSVGYVSAGFWAGITLGRFLLAGPARRIGEKRFVYGVVAGSAIFELIVWLVPNIVGDAVAVSIVGLLLGPVYPCAAAVLMRVINRSELVSGMGVVSAFGCSGGAVAPFTTGLLAQVVGAFVLHPIAIGLFAAMAVCWYFLPSQPKKTE